MKANVGESVSKSIKHLIRSLSSGAAKKAPKNETVSSNEFDDWLENSQKFPKNDHFEEVETNRFKMESIQSRTYNESEPIPTSEDTSSEEIKDQKPKEASADSDDIPIVAAHWASLGIRPALIEDGSSPPLRRFMEQAIDVIRKIDLASGKKEYIFSIKNPPMQLRFDSGKNDVTMRISGGKESQDLIEELVKKHHELKLSLQQLFQKQELTVIIDGDVTHSDDRGQSQSEGESQSSDQSPNQEEVSE